MTNTPIGTKWVEAPSARGGRGSQREASQKSQGPALSVPGWGRYLLDLARSTGSAAGGPSSARLSSLFFCTRAPVQGKIPSVSDFHTPVLPDEVVASFAPALEGPSDGASRGERTVVDLTCGGGGHSALLLQRFSPTRQLVVDRDQEALNHAREKLSALARAQGTELVLKHARFSQLPEILDDLSAQNPGWSQPHVIFADIGVSSHQLDEGTRGFSFRQDAPLDMRMDSSRGETAAELLARSTVEQIARILRELGQEPDALRIARALCAQLPTTTTQLAELVTESMSAVGRRKLGKRVHPATRTFQALRIAVNHELEELDSLLELAPARLAPGGRLGIISFHSLEDGKIKRRFRGLSRAESPPSSLPIPASELPQAPFLLPPIYGRGIDAQSSEVQANPRARSARLRVLQRRETP